LSGIIAAIGYSSWSIFVLKSSTPAVGASGALFGIFACLAILAPYIQVYIFFIPMKITHALVLFAVVDLLFLGGTTSGLITQDIVARSAHLSGAVAGLVMGKKIKESGRYQR
ncbi:MAG: rhomboid family intramembrane serine protease, partial [Candidatus Methanoperedens sp.]|nr:rhomboid family intramembrane serine protease [Candidatus Methanoperedens sp.]